MHFCNVLIAMCLCITTIRTVNLLLVLSQRQINSAGASAEQLGLFLPHCASFEHRDQKKGGVEDNKVLMLCHPRLIWSSPPWGRSQTAQPTAPHSCSHTHALLITGALGCDSTVSRTWLHHAAFQNCSSLSAQHFNLLKGPPVSAQTTRQLKPLTDCCGQSKTLFIPAFYFSESGQRKKSHWVKFNNTLQ